MGIGDFLFGKKEKTKKIETMSREQKKILEGLLSQIKGIQGKKGPYQQALGELQSYLSPSEEAQAKFDEPYLRQFQEELLPSIAEEYAGAGALSSSAFGQSIGAAGGRLQSQLAQLREQRKGQSIQDILGLYTNLTGVGLGQQPFGYTHREGSSGVLPGLIQAGARGAVSYATGGLF